MRFVPPPLANSRVSAQRSPGGGGGDGRQVTVSPGAASRSTKRSTHARPGMHMQQCSAVPLIRWFREHFSICTGCTYVCLVILFWPFFVSQNL